MALLILHTRMIGQGHTIDAYEALRNVTIVILASLLCVKYVLRMQRNTPQTLLYAVIAALLVPIVIIHVLRLFLGGLPCA